MASQLETERLRLRPLTPADIDNLVALDSDPEVMRYLTGGAPTPRQVLQSRILPAFVRSSEGVAGLGVWAAILRATGEFLGWVSFRPLDGGDPTNISLGYRLHRAAWGRGFATEGARALIRRGFTELSVQRVYATTYEYNFRSRRVLEKLGMTLVRRFRLTAADLAEVDTFDHASSADQDVWDGDEVEYALLRSEWERREAVLPPGGYT